MTVKKTRGEELERMSLDSGFWREGNRREAKGAHRRRQGCLNIGTDHYHFMLSKPASEE